MVLVAESRVHLSVPPGKGGGGAPGSAVRRGPAATDWDREQGLELILTCSSGNEEIGRRCPVDVRRRLVSRKPRTDLRLSGRLRAGREDTGR
jgi:hypothetical protein